MTFARVKALGWAFGEILTSAQMNALDIDHALAVDGDAGGVYGAPLTFTSCVSLGTDELIVGGTNTVDLNARTVTRMIVGQPMPDVAASWLQPAILNGFNQTAVNTVTYLTWTFVLPNAALVTGFDVYVIGAAAHGGLPGTMPNLALYRVGNSPFGGLSAIGNQSDTSASTGAYQAAHQIVKTGLAPAAHAADTGVYMFTFASEFGANALSGLKVAQPRIYFTASRLDEM